MPKRTREWTKNVMPSKKSMSVHRHALQLAKAARIVAQTEEKKYLDSHIGFTDMTQDVGVVSGLINVAEGTEFNQRVGRKIRLKYLQYDLAFSATSAAIQAFPVHYIAHLILDTQSNGAVPAFGTIFDTTVSDTTLAFKNVAQEEKRFKILKTFTGAIAQDGLDPALRQRGFLDLTHLGADGVVQYSGSSNAAPPTSNNLLIAFSSVEGAANQAEISYTIRVVYTDM